VPLGWGTRIRSANFGVTPLPALQSWQNGTDEFGGARTLYEEVETLWVLDIDGTVVRINTRLWSSVTKDWRALDGPGVAARARFAAVLDSIRIDRK
jgi:hypothetical protein